MRVIFFAQLVLSASLKIEDEAVTAEDNLKYTAEHRDADLQKHRHQMKKAMAKNSGGSLIQLKKNAASKSDTQSLKQMSTQELKQEIGAGVSILQQAQRAEMKQKLAAYRAQVGYQVALEQKVNEILLQKATARAEQMKKMSVSEMTLTDRKELGLLSEAELKQYAAIEARMNEYLKVHEPYQVAAKEAQHQIYAEVMDNIKANPHYLMAPVSLDDMDYLIDLFGGSTLKQARDEVAGVRKVLAASLLQKDEPEDSESDEPESDEESNKMVERMENAASFANNIDRLRKSDWAQIINARMGNPVGKGKFAWGAGKAFNKKMAVNRALGKTKCQDCHKAEPVVEAAAEEVEEPAPEEEQPEEPQE